jgi:ribonucleoside-triphosphate reductase
MNTKEWLLKKIGKDTFLRIEGFCHDCKKPVVVEVEKDGKEITCDNPFWYEPKNRIEQFFVKCKECFEKNPKLTNYRETEVFSRVVGYLRPVQAWNPGKKEEMKQRKNFIIKEEV